ncbi:interferon-stimulated 20 kDa exonuclease-like 2 isoform X2 [Brachyhypopomus gauderio]|uniref:interferon-stimulated 20 kDa exonuclease-like 2 isoform X2 n=1 Tax=Brachyhypopomus gauderio TaxID=698409 RepID=UPI0040418E10
MSLHSFLRRRRVLEKRGLLKKKQNANNCEKHTCRKKPWQGKNKKNKDSCTRYPQSSTPPAELSTNPSSSAQVHHENSVSGIVKESTVPSSSESQIQFSSALSSVATCTGIPLKYIAIDCEMVGTGPKGQCSELARCSVVSYDGDVIYDKFIKPVNPVTDLRTRWSGVRWKDLRKATPFREAQKEILKILSGKVIVGHAIHHDLKVLHYSHPAFLIRDTSRIPILNRKAGLPENQTASLKKLTKILFNKDIQMEKKGHSSVEDAKATMELYKIVQVEWERTLPSNPGS